MNTLYLNFESIKSVHNVNINSDISSYINDHIFSLFFRITLSSPIWEFAAGHLESDLHVIGEQVVEVLHTSN